MSDQGAAAGMGQSFPVAEYYRSQIEDAVTINRAAGWWLAALLIRDPKTEKRFVGLYKWQMKKGTWKLHQKLHINNNRDASKLADTLVGFGKLLKQ